METADEIASGSPGIGRSYRSRALTSTRYGSAPPAGAVSRSAPATGPGSAGPPAQTPAADGLTSAKLTWPRQRLDKKLSTAPLPNAEKSRSITLRFLSVYFAAYILFTKILSDIVRIPRVNTPNLGLDPTISSFVLWVAHKISPSSGHLEIIGGSGDKLYDWVLTGLLLLASVAITGIWLLIEPRIDGRRSRGWGRLVLRMALGATLIEYGSMKVFPDQMPEPSLVRLLEPYGQFSLFSSLWANIGASPAYEMTLGIIEIVTGVLVILPLTELLGALMAVGVTSQVFVLNLTYDVPVKLFSFHLLLMAVVLSAPDAGRLWKAVARPGTKASTSLALLLLSIYVVGAGLWFSGKWWTGPYGGGQARTPLYGVWTIDRMTIDGIERAPLVTDYERWRRVVIQSGATGVNLAFWRMNDTAEELTARIDVRLRTIVISAPTGVQESILRFSQADSSHLDLEGTVHGRALRMVTHAEPASFPLLRRDFHWIQEHALTR